jgi:uncharacterized membrane protein
MKHGRNRLLQATALIGIGLMAAVEEIVFHQLLAWHHFYDRSTSDVGLLTDGLLHAAELVAIVAGFFMWMDLRDRNLAAPQLAWGGFLVGAGGFQIFDGLVDHKVLRVHQVRYGVELFPYDLAWNAGGVVLLLIGIILIRQAPSGEISRHSSDAEG